MDGTASSDLLTALARFRLQQFRPGQQDVIASVLDGRDCLCIMPTGGGKSLCYQLPSVVREGVTLVVSPLIALMKDQVDGLQSLGLRATFINSSLPAGEQRTRMDQMAAGEFDLVYIAPERLRNSRFLEAARESQVQLLAVDEAHCISEWGHDFRPDYARLGKFRERLGYPQTIALTATATPTVREDVVRALELREPQVFVTGFARPNLRFEVQSPASVREKDEMLTEFLRRTPGCGIIYAATRKRCEELADRLQLELAREPARRRVGIYHAGLLPDERREVQERFMAGEISLVVATNAFGMGIDKSDLRFVVHYNMPRSLEAYYQEAGRAGRDGQRSVCLLLFSPGDRYVQEFFIENAYPARDTVARVYEFLRRLEDDPIEITLESLKERLELPVGSEGVGACEQVLEKCGALERLSSQENLASVRIDSDLETLVDLLPREARVQRRVLRAVERIVGDRRHERVFFPLKRLLRDCDLEREPLLRALRQLCKLKSFDYVPPFRGRAVHMLCPDVPFDQLEIDFDELERRKAAEFEKLDRVMRFARTSRCRQLEVLEYFGDPDRRRCGCCDNCTGKDVAVDLDGVSDETSEAVLQAVRIALSGVARLRGRYGRQLVAQMLWGSKNSRIKKLKFDQLSTFGLLAHLQQTEVNELIDALLAAELVCQVEVERFRPVLQLTDRGHDVMRGVRPLDHRFALPAELLARLSGRRHVGVVAGSSASPAGTSFASVTSPERADAERGNSQGDGAGGSRSDPAGHAAAPTSSPSGTSPSSPSGTSPSLPSGTSPSLPSGTSPSLPSGTGPGAADGDQPPSHYWTWRLLQAGFTEDECARIRGLDAATIREHQRQLEVDGEWDEDYGPQ